MTTNRYNSLAELFAKVSGITDAKSTSLLVVGAGEGSEVLALRNDFPNLEAIELDYDKVSDEAKPFVKKGDATKLNFPDDSFDAVYCYHVLEHIIDYNAALVEMKRVLKSDGILYLGVPNKSRIISYILVKETPFKDKLLWNWADYKARMNGSFENALGAHAGFTNAELNNILSVHFPNVRDITADYYDIKYGDSKLVKVLRTIPVLKRVTWPSIYFLCRN